MNRADRRHLQRATAKAIEKATSRRPAGLTHAPPTGNITLIGGPMNNWVVRPNAPALKPEWHAGLIEAIAAGLVPPGMWATMTEDQREPYREQARAKHPPGRYILTNVHGRSDRIEGGHAEWAEDRYRT
jgi:hypothetical protein